jgi:hypothetical protein
MTTNIASRTMRLCTRFLIRRREKLLKALEGASRRYKNSDQKERQAFFHGLLTGYAVALKLW